METRLATPSWASGKIKSGVVDLDGPVHYADFGGERRPLVLVAGLGGAIENWLSVAPRLTDRGHVVALDLRGHGRTPLGPGQTASVQSNRELLERFIDALFDEPVILIGHSMGAMISILLTARTPDLVAGLILVDASVPAPESVEIDPVIASLFATYATPGAGEEFLASSYASLGSEAVARRTMALNCVDVNRIDPAVLQAHVDLAKERESMDRRFDAFLQATRSLLEVNARRDDYYSIIRSLDVPGLILHGDSDRFIPLASAEAVSELRPEWTFEIYEDTGHMSPLERPDLVVASIERWLQADPSKT